MTNGVHQTKPVSAVAVMILSTTLLLACPQSTNKGADSKPPQLPTGTVILQPAGQHIRVQVEVVRKVEDRARGLMYRKQLAENSGMLFIFDKEEVQSFWMKNTYIPLDMIFISRARKVVGVVHDAEPMTTESRAIDEASLYTLEVNAGFAKQHGIVAGTPVKLDI